MSFGLRKALLAVAAVVVIIALLYRARGAIGLEGFSGERLLESVREANPLPLLLSLVTIFACYAVRAQRWVRLSRHIGRTTFTNVYAATIIGFTGVFLLGRAGEPLRPLLIARKDKLPVSSLFGIYVLERIFDTAATAVLAGLSLLIIPRHVLAARENQALLAVIRSTGLLLLVGLLAATAFLVYLRLRGIPGMERAKTAPSAGWYARGLKMLAGFGEGLGAIRNFSDLFAALAYTVFHWFLVALIYLWVSHSFEGRLAAVNFSGAMLLLAFTMVGSTLQLPGVGGGSQLASFLAFTVILGVEKEPAAAASIVLWLITFAASGLVGVPLLIREGWSMGELRRLARAEAEAEAAGTHISVSDNSLGSISRNPEDLRP